MGRADFVSLNASAALAVGTIMFLAYSLYQGYWPNTSLERPWYLTVVLPFPVAAAISAYLSFNETRFHQRAQWAETSRLCVLTYIVYAPLLAATLFLAPEFDGWGALMFILAFPLVVAVTIIPFLWLEYMIVGKARSRRTGE